MRKPRDVEVGQLAAWIDAGLLRQMRARCREGGPTQRAFLEEAIRRELARPTASVATTAARIA